jgi:hypothetical protein
VFGGGIYEDYIKQANTVPDAGIPVSRKVDTALAQQAFFCAVKFCVCTMRFCHQLFIDESEFGRKVAVFGVGNALERHSCFTSK